MITKLEKFIEKIDKGNYIESFKKNKYELAYDHDQKERELTRQWSKIKSQCLEEKDLSLCLNKLGKINNLLNDLDLEYDNDINRLSNKLYKSIEKTLDSKISYETFSEIMRHYNLKDFLTKEISTIKPTREKGAGRVFDYDYYYKQPISKLKTEIEKLKITSKNENDLMIAQKVLKNKLHQIVISDEQEELQEFKKGCSLKDSTALKDIVFDESGDYTENEKRICMNILKKRHNTLNK